MTNKYTVAWEAMQRSVKPLWLLMLFLPAHVFSQETIYYQGWEGVPGENGLYGFEQYNNQTWSQQNVWARKGFTGINQGGANKFRILNPFPQCGDNVLDSCIVADTANFKGLNGAHIITGAMVNRSDVLDSTFKHNQNHTGYHNGPYCQLPFGCNGQTAATNVGLYSQKLLANNAYASVRLEFWMRVNGEFNRDYGLLRYSTNPNAPSAPLTDGSNVSAPDNYWTTATFTNNDVGVLAKPLVNTFGDTIRYLPINKPGSLIPGQLQGMVAPAGTVNQPVGSASWVKISYLLPRECAGDTNLRIGFWWVNDNNGKGAFPALMVDEIRLTGWRFATKPLAEAIYCPGSPISIPFEIDTQFLQDSIVNIVNGDTVFYAMLSDSSGSFANAKNIGQITLSQLTHSGGLSTGTIQGLIPLGITQIAIGGYRVRIVAPKSNFKATLSPTVISIFPPPAVVVKPAQSQICEGETIRLTATGGADYYRWYRNNVEVAFNTEDSTYVTGLAGNYTVEAHFAKCVSKANVGAFISVLPRPAVSLIIPDSLREICYLKNISNLRGGSPIPGTYFWYYEGDTTYGNSFSSVLAGVGKHVIGYRHQSPINGCYGYAFDTITVLNIPYATIIPDADTIGLCAGIPLSLTTSNPATGYLWSNGETTREINITTGGLYYVDLVNEEGCTYRTDDVLIVQIPATLSAPTLSPNLQPGSSNLTGTATYLDGIPVVVSIYVNDVAVGTTNVKSDGTWTFTLNKPLVGGDKVYARVRTDSNCDGTVDASDVLSPNSNIVIIGGDEPTTGFSPNGDGKNDVWVIIPNLQQRYPGAILTVYNRWGSEVFSEKGYDNTWDGGDLPDGTYYFVLDLNNGSKVKSGYVTILR